MCNLKNCKCDSIILPTIPGPAGPQGPQGIQGIQGIQGPDGESLGVIIESKGPQAPLTYLVNEDKTLDFLTVPAGTMEIGDKIQAYFLMNVTSIEATAAFPLVQPTVALTNTLPSVGGARLFPAIVIGDQDSPKEGTNYYIVFNITRLGMNSIVVEGNYRLGGPFSNTLSSPGTSYATRTIYNYQSAFSQDLDDTFYLSIALGQDFTSCIATLLYSSVEIKKPV